ncbi:MAG: tRNA (adenosine(37)-N6)-threonylcarbamoyltransferase complex transferase subunit TsaD [Fibrobacterota bacterium]
MLTLGIETSCDETSAAVVDERFEVLSNVIHTQQEHGRFGGVVPEIASREHVIKIESVVSAALEKAGVKKEDLGLIAATNAPGLMGALLVGLSFAKGLAFSLGRPFVAVNHLDAHIRANLIGRPGLVPPYVALVVSGGHTFLVHDDGTRYCLLGNTLDDAAGEAIDKAGKLMGLPYPAGREMEAIAKGGDPAFFDFPRALPERRNLNFSFSGLKTALKNYLKTRTEEDIARDKPSILAAYQEAVVDQLARKSADALQRTKCHRLLIAGGVACNGRLREKLQLLMGKRNQLYFPAPALCTDNGAMIAVAGLVKFTKKGPDPLDTGASAVFNLSEVNYGS